MIRLGVSAALLCVSCAPSVFVQEPKAYWQPIDLPILVQVSEDFPAAERVYVEGAIAWWNARIGCEVFTLRPKGTGVITVSPCKGRNVCEDATGKWFNGTVHRIYIRTGGYNVERTIAHELGHALGLEHDPTDPESIMWGRKRVPYYLDARTARELHNMLCVYYDDRRRSPCVGLRDH